MDSKDRWKIRWYCPRCGRVDPRHPKTKIKELPTHHNPPGRIGNIIWMWNMDKACFGERIPQKFDEIRGEWVNENESMRDI